MEMSFRLRLQALRDRVGKPIRVTSGYRCSAHPVERIKKPGSFSAHTYGIAADITCAGLTIEQLFRAALEDPAFKGIGVNPWQNFIHLDARATPARWAYNRMNRTVPWSGKWEDLTAATGFSFTKVE